MRNRAAILTLGVIATKVEVEHYCLAILFLTALLHVPSIAVKAPEYSVFHFRK